jgi:hypothetical protein
LKLKYDEPLSNVAFNFNLRRYSKASFEAAAHIARKAAEAAAADTANKHAEYERLNSALKVGRCRLTVSKPESTLKARLISALETKM